MKQNSIITIAFGFCFAIALGLGVRAQQLSGGGGSAGGGGTPCTVTALSLQYNNASAFGCTTEWLYTSAKKSLGDGTNFQFYFDSSSEIAFLFRNAADNAYVNIIANIVKGRTIQADTTGAVQVGASGADAYIPGAGFDTIGYWTRAAGQFRFSSTASASGTVDTALARNAAGVVEVINGTANTYREVKLRSVISGGTVPGISGCSAGTQTGGATAGTFVSGTTGACTVVLTLAFTAPTGWSCAANNQTTPNLIRQSASSTTTATITGTTVTSDVVNFHCMAY